MVCSVYTSTARARLLKFKNEQVILLDIYRFYKEGYIEILLLKNLFEKNSKSAWSP